jgi:hypothetical protein
MRALALLMLCACGAGQRPHEDLVFDLRTYHEGLRWRRYEQAADYIAPDDRNAFLDHREEIDKDLRIDDYETVRVTISTEKQEAVVQVKYVWHLDTVGTVHETTVEEQWKKLDKGWRLVETTHKRGEEMPQ